MTGVVFTDLDRNGRQDADEAGVAAVIVTLMQNGNSLASLVTDANGQYTFANLSAGGYTVQIAVPTGFVATSATAWSVRVVSGLTGSVHFGIQPQGSIVGMVFDDLNGNSFQEQDEPGLAGVTLHLLSNGAIIQSTTSANNGRYRFTDVTPGSYLLRMVTPAGYVVGTRSEQPVTLVGGDAAGADFDLQAQGAIGGVLYHDRNGNRSQDANEPGISAATVTLLNADGPLAGLTTDSAGRYRFPGLTPGVYQVQATVPDQWVAQGALQRNVNLGSGGAAVANFGYQARGAIGGVVFRDLDGDGNQSRTENGLTGVTVQLFQHTLLVTSTVSSDEGSYLFSHLLPGNYLVAIILPTDFAAVTPLQQPVALADGSGINLGFGLQPVSTIAGIVYADRNGDGVRQNSETGINNATVTLFTAGPDGVFRTGDEVMAANTTSNADGAYTFVNQAVGAYAVQLTTPVGYTATSPSEVVVNLAQFWTAVANFGNQALNTVVATTFEDRNNNGIQDEDEEPLAGLPVILEPLAQVQSAAMTANYSATTNSAGLVTFHDLPAATYQVRTQAPVAGYVGRRTLAQITLAPNGVAGEHFGFQQIGTVSGAIFVDSDGNGRQDAGESGLGGVVVTLQGQAQAATAGTAGLNTTVSASDGSYSFGGLTAGSYQLVVTPPAGYVATEANPVNVALSAAGTDAAVAVSMGFVTVGNVSGRVFADLNKNGAHDLAELGVSGATVTLRGDGVADRTVQTAVDGGFLLTGVANGVYRATLTLPPNHTATTALEAMVTVDGAGAATVRFGVRPNLPIQAPVLTFLPDVDFLVGQPITITVNATDADDTTLSYSATGLPSGLAINSSTGLISGQPAANSAGSYLVTVTVTDPQGALAQQTFNLIIVPPTAIDEEAEQDPVLTERLYLPLIVQ